MVTWRCERLDFENRSRYSVVSPEVSSLSAGWGAFSRGADDRIFGVVYMKNEKRMCTRSAHLMELMTDFVSSRVNICGFW